MFHQGFWQRVYTCRDEASLRRGFAAAGIIVIPVIFLAGLLGIMAVGLDVAKEPSVALFSVVLEVMPTWAIVIVLVLALMLVMSSLDTLLNGIASAATSDLARVKPEVRGVSLLRSTRAITVVLVIPAIVIASQGYSVLYLFLIADLVCAAAVFPVFFGLYSKRIGDVAAFASCGAGLVVGALFFPTPDFTPWLDIPQGGKFVVSFGTALGASALMSVILSALSTRVYAGAEYDFSHLRERVHLIEG
jgi:Na+/proline symporter